MNETELKALADKSADELQRSGSGLTTHPLREWWGVLEDWIPETDKFDNVRYALVFSNVKAIETTTPYPQTEATLPSIKISPNAHSTWGCLIDSIDKLNGGTDLVPGKGKLSDVRGKMVRWKMVEVDYGDLGKYPSIAAQEYGDAAATTTSESSAEAAAIQICLGVNGDPIELAKAALKNDTITEDTDLVARITGKTFISEMIEAGKLAFDADGNLIKGAS